MTRLMLFSARHPWTILALLMLFTGLAALPLPRLSVDVSSKALLPTGGKVRALHDYVESRYGGAESSVVVFSDVDLLAKDRLEAIASAIRSLRALPFVKDTRSLFSVPDIKVVDDFVHTDPYLETLPETPAQRSDLVRAALFNPLVAGSLLSEDGQTMAVDVELAGGEWDDAEVVNGIEAVIAPLRPRFNRVVQVGGPRIREAIGEHITKDQRRIIPLSVVVLVLMMAVLLRSGSAALLPLLTAGLSVVWILGLMAALAIPLGVMTAIVPALLVVIGSTEDIHLLTEYRSGIDGGKSRSAALHDMTMRMGTAVTLTAVTTYVGFLSIALNDLQMLREFGLLASTGLLFNFLITVTLLPAALALGGPRRFALAASSGRAGAKFAAGIATVAMRHRRLLLGATAVLAMVFLYGATFVRINNNSLDFLPAGDPVVTDTLMVERRLTGTEALSVVVRAGIADTFLKARYLESVSRLQRQIDRLPGVDRTLSFADYMALINTVMGEREGDHLILPDSDDLLREYALFLRREHVQPYVLDDFSEARIVVRHHIRSSQDLENLIDRIRVIADREMEAGLSVHLTGASVLSAHAARGMAMGQAQSLGLMIIMIFVVVSVLFWNPWAGVVAVVPNSLPVIMLFGIMGFAGIPLDNGTAMVAAIALGVCVDDTMHFLVRYHENTQAGAEERTALSDTIRGELSPIVATSIALALGFAVLALSSFPPVVRFGLLSAMVMVLALLATFLIAPAMLATVRLITLWEMFSLRLRSEVISRCALFRGLKPRQIKQAVLLSGISEFTGGSRVVSQGDTERRLYVVLEGTVEVWKGRRDGARDLLTILGPGEVFGEIALVSDSPRTADVVAVGWTRVLAFDWQGLDRVARRDSALASLLFRNLSDILAVRLAHSDEHRMLIRDTPTGAFSMSYFQAHLSLEVERMRRYAEPLTLVSFEVVEKAALTYGPDRVAGIEESVLKVIADYVRESTRTVDLFARCGGSRFILMLSRTDVRGAEPILDRLRARMGDDSAYRLLTAIVPFREGDEPEAVLNRVAEVLAADGSRAAWG